MTVFVSVDGPKGVGKTTILDLVERHISATHSVLRVAEKDLDPFRADARRLLAGIPEEGDQTLEMEAVRLMARGRREVTAWLSTQKDTDVVLMDRWYPSDAALRRSVAFADSYAENMRLEVAVPDLVIALLCEPDLAWERANGRGRGLDSLVIRSRADHERSFVAFAAAAVQSGWSIVHNDGAADDTARTISQIVLGAMEAR